MLWQKPMLSVKGKFKNGVAQPSEPIEGHDGQAVIITFLGAPHWRRATRYESKKLS